jgi:hypothetical protein
VTARAGAPPGKRRGRPRQETGHPVADTLTGVEAMLLAGWDTTVDLARRWRVLRLGCPAGCPLDHHEPPCHLSEVA